MAYFSNGSEGEVLEAQCAECPIGRHDAAKCPVLLVQALYNYEQIGPNGERNQLAEVLNFLINEHGICQLKPVLEKYTTSKGLEVSRKVDPRNLLPGTESFAKKAGLI